MIRHNIAVRRPQDLPALRDWLIDIRPDGAPLLGGERVWRLKGDR